MESTGKLAWLRHGPEIHKYITEELGGVLLEKHTKTGLNTSKFQIKQVRAFLCCKTALNPLGQLVDVNKNHTTPRQLLKWYQHLSYSRV